MNILVTGGAGFLGSNLVMRLLYQGHSVTAVDNLLTGTLANLGNAFKQYPETFSFINRNVSQRGATLGPIDHGAGWDRVYHLASAASPAVYKKHPIKTLRVGTIGTENMLQHANHWRARMLFASTSEVYGQPLKHPQSEGYFGNVNPIGPRSMYDEAKRCGEAFVMAYHYAKGVDTRIARIFNTYGPGLRGDDGRMIPAFVMAALAGEAIPVHGSGLQTRTLCYVDDTVDGLIRLMENESTEAHLPVNIGGHQEMTVAQVARDIWEATGKRGPGPTLISQPCFDDPIKRKPSTLRALERLSWEPWTPWEEGLKRTVAWYRDGQPPVEYRRSS